MLAVAAMVQNYIHGQRAREGTHEARQHWYGRAHREAYHLQEEFTNTTDETTLQYPTPTARPAASCSSVGGG
ncbi:hypothetical protein V2G26_020528 [Clonostachys chloroleuca]